MTRKIIFWVLAILITLASVIYQRKTGPTYPIDGVFTRISGEEIDYSLTRSHGGDGDQEVVFHAEGSDLRVELHYRRYNVDEEHKVVEMQPREDGALHAWLPHQPPAGKLEYYLLVKEEGRTSNIPTDREVVTRFKGSVPASILVPHILFMFIAMLFSSRAGLEALDPAGDSRKLSYTTAGTLLIGGMILGPVVQLYAFGDLWTGVPFGWDLTDNKTLIAMIGWGVAVWKHYKNSPHKHLYTVAAAVILLAVYMIPHSAMGSELNYETGEIMTG